MPQAANSHQPSTLYVFVTLFLATFLLLFTIWREPGTFYETAVSFESDASRQQLTAGIMAPECVLRSLRNADMIDGAHPNLNAIAADISQRMQLHLEEAVGRGMITLTTRQPQAATKLLDTLVMAFSRGHAMRPLADQPATIARVQGGSVAAGQLVLLSALAGIMGFCGVWLTQRAFAVSKLLTREDVESILGLPVLTEFPGNKPIPRQANKLAQRRLARVAVRAAEVTVAAVFLLMLYQLATQRGLPSRFFQDPLAAYGEALTRVIG